MRRWRKRLVTAVAGGVVSAVATGALCVAGWRLIAGGTANENDTVYAGPPPAWAVVVGVALLAALLAVGVWAVWRRRKLGVAAGLSLLLGAASAGVWVRAGRGDSFNLNWCGTAGPPPENDPAWRDPRTDPPDAPVEGHSADATVVRPAGSGRFVINRGRADLLRPGVRFEVYDATRTRTPALPRRGKATASVVQILGPHASVCAVSGGSPDWPVRVGDVVAAEAYQPGTRRWYLVAGAFDLDLDGKFELTDAQAVEQAVAQLGGGRVVGSRSHPDVVILGREPDPYVPPALGADHPVHQANAAQVAARIDDYRRTVATAEEHKPHVVDQQWVARVLGYPAHAKYPPVPRRALRVDSGGGRLQILFESGIDWRERRPRWMVNWERRARRGRIPPRWPALAAPGPQSLWRRAGFGADYASVPATAAGAPTGYPVKGRQTGWAVTAPHWAVTGIFAILPLAWLVRTGRHEVRRRRGRRGLCEACGYDLRASRETGRCPECGRAIQP